MLYRKIQSNQYTWHPPRRAALNPVLTNVPESITICSNEKSLGTSRCAGKLIGHDVYLRLSFVSQCSVVTHSIQIGFISNTGRSLYRISVHFSYVPSSDMFHYHISMAVCHLKPVSSLIQGNINNFENYRPILKIFASNKFIIKICYILLI